MKHFLLYLMLIFTVSCARPPSKNPTDEDKKYREEIQNIESKRIVDEYMYLSTQYHISFTRKVDIKFTKIEQKNIIGLCHFGFFYRYISIDSRYWYQATWESKVALLYHELTHCYCGRYHDFDDGTEYPDDPIKSFIDSFMAGQPFGQLKPPGYLDDSCPKSIMHPVILSNQCFRNHYEYYTKEMFDRCKPY